MKKYIALLTLFSSSFITQAALADAGNALVARQAIKERQATFILVQRSFKNMADMAQGKRDFNEAIARTEIQRIASLSSLLPELFPAGSAMDGKGTKAAASIWENNVEFTEAMERYVKLTQKLAGTDHFTLQELQQAVGAVGKECKSCHNDFKSK